MKVEYVDSMGDDISIVNAARVSFAKESNYEIEGDEEGEWNFKLPEKDAKLLKYLADHNHWSPFSHTSISLRIKAPLFVARQLGKHQVGLAWNEVSRRYVDDPPTFFTPDKWRSRPEGNIKQGSGDGEVKKMYLRGFRMTPLDEAYDTLLEHAADVYEGLLEAGVSPEQARMVLPQSMNTEWIWTGSLYAFARVCNLRLDPHAQVECREVAKKISDIIKPIFPISWSVLVDQKEEA